MNTLWVGIDMAKASLTAAAVWQTERVALGEFSNDTAGFTALASAVQAAQVRAGAEHVQWVVEPTGGYAP